MSALCIALLSAFTGALSAFVLMLFKELISKHRKEKAALVEIKYWIGKYLNQIKDAKSWYAKNRKAMAQQFEVPIGKVDFEKEFSTAFRESLQWGKFNTEDLEFLVGIKPNFSELIFLTIKDEGLLDSILLSRTHYTEFINSVKKRNELLDIIDRACSNVANPDEFVRTMRFFEDKIIPLTQHLMSILEEVEKNLDTAYKNINRKLNLYFA